MKNFLKSGLLVAVAVMSLAGTSRAGVLNFGGTASSSTSAYNSIGWKLVVNYVSSATSSTTWAGALTFATLVPEVYTVTGVFPYSSSLSVNGGLDQLSITGFSAASTPYTYGQLSLTLQSTFDASQFAVASDATVQALGTSIGSSFVNAGAVASTFTLLPGGPVITLNGSVAAPEPGSIAVLCGLGLIVGRRVLKSRSSKKQEVAA